MITFLCIVIALLTVALTVSVRQLLRLSETIFDLEEQVEESLDVLNESYSRLASFSEMQVFSDEPVVKDLVKEISNSRESILLVANKIVTFSGEKNDRQQ